MTDFVISDSLRTLGDVIIGTTPAQSGAIRLPNAGTISFRNFANDADIPVLAFGSSDIFEIGDQANPTALAQIQLYSDEVLIPSGRFAIRGASTVALLVETVSSVVVFKVDSQSDPTSAVLLSNGSVNAADGAEFLIQRSRGSSIINTGDTIGRLIFEGDSGPSFVGSASIVSVAEGTVASTRIGSRLVFSTGTDAAPTVLTEALRFDSLQRATFGLDNTSTHTEPTYDEAMNLVSGNLEVINPSSVGSESLQDGNFSSFTNWANASDFSEGTLNYVYLHSGGSGTLLQTAANRTLSGKDKRWYRFTYTLTSVTNVGALAITISGSGFPDENVQLADPANGTFTVIFQSDQAASVNDFQISASSDTGGDGFTIDDVSLVEIIGGDLIMGGKLTGGGSLGLRIDELGSAFLGGPSIAIGTTPAVAGSIRLPNSGDIVFRNTANDGDLNFFSFGASDQATLGDAGMTSIDIPAPVLQVRDMTVIGTVNGESTRISRASITVLTTSGSVVTATNLIPSGVLVLAVTTRVITAVTGPAGFDVGDGSTIDRWGNSLPTGLGAVSDATDQVVTSIQVFPSANDVVVTSDGVDFTAGEIRITVHFISFAAALS